MSYTGKTRKYENPDEFINKIIEYFAEIERENEAYFQTIGKIKTVPSKAGMCSHLGIVKSTFDTYAKRPEFAEAAVLAIQELESFKVTNASLGLINYIFAMFDLKNNHGYKDKTEIDFTEKKETLTPEEVRERMEAKAFRKKLMQEALEARNGSSN